MTLGNVWAFPSKTMSYDTTLDAMKALADADRRASPRDCRETGHPLDLTHVLEPEYLKAAEEVSAARALDEPIPKLCTLVVASPFDAAMHDAFGKVHGLNVYAPTAPTSCRTTCRTISATTSAANGSIARAAEGRSRGCRCITSSAGSIRWSRRTSRSRSATACPRRCPSGSRSTA